MKSFTVEELQAMDDAAFDAVLDLTDIEPIRVIGHNGRDGVIMDADAYRELKEFARAIPAQPQQD